MSLPLCSGLEGMFWESVHVFTMRDTMLNLGTPLGSHLKIPAKLPFACARTRPLVCFHSESFVRIT